jgi:hypothetical protein
MRNAIFAGVLMTGMVAGAPLFAQTNADEIAQLKQRVGQLEQQVEELSRLVEPLKAQQATDSRRKGLRERFEKKMTEDQRKYTREQLREAEQLYQIANQKWGSPEASQSLQTMIKKYPNINRTGCATLYVAQKSEGDERARYLQDCIEKYNDSFYGDGVQVGVYARFLLAADYQSKDDDKKARALYDEIKTKYADAVDHSGKLLVRSIEIQGE